MRSMSIRFRLTALFVAIFGVTLIAFAALTYNTFSVNAQAEFDAGLYNYSADIAESIDINLFGEILIQKEPLSSARRLFPFSVRNALVQIANSSGRIVARSEELRKFSLPLDRSDLEFLAAHGTELRTYPGTRIMGGSPRVGGAAGAYRVLDRVVRDRGPYAFILQVAVPDASLQEQRRRLLLFIFTSIPITLLVATLGGLFLSRRALLPVRMIIERVRSMGSADLGERLPVPPSHDEMRQLSLTLNGLLSRLQLAFQSQERFISDASHELKTPLSILRGELDVLRSRARPMSELLAFLGSASQELDYLSRIVEDLLLLARVDAGVEALSPTQTRLDELLLEAIERLDPAAKKKEIRIRFDLDGNDFGTRGDADLLRGLFKNLIENSIKFSPEGSLVEVRLVERERTLIVTVKDQGPGIPPELAGRVFERFYRGPDAQKKAPGTGLGLAIARRIAEVHEADLTLVPMEASDRNEPVNTGSSAGPGALFRFEIKKF